jgi:putative sigma-54 modulation protein
MERQVRERREKVRQKRANSSSPKAPLGRSGKAGEEKEEEEELTSLVQRRRTVAKRMSLEEAVSQLGLSKKNFLVFVNSDSGQMNVVYRSKDGGYEWVEPYPK